MDLKINREMLPVTEILLDEVQEQSVELDYVLPDYDPDIFRIIGCEIRGCKMCFEYFNRPHHLRTACRHSRAVLWFGEHAAAMRGTADDIHQKCRTAPPC